MDHFPKPGNGFFGHVVIGMRLQIFGKFSDFVFFATMGISIPSATYFVAPDLSISPMVAFVGNHDYSPPSRGSPF